MQVDDRMFANLHRAVAHFEATVALEFLRAAVAAGRGKGLHGYLRLLQEDLARKERQSRELPALAYLSRPLVRK